MLLRKLDNKGNRSTPFLVLGLVNCMLILPKIVSQPCALWHICLKFTKISNATYKIQPFFSSLYLSII